MLFFGGRSGIEVFYINFEQKLQRIGMNGSIQNVTSIISLFETIIAVHEKGEWSYLSSDV